MRLQPSQTVRGSRLFEMANSRVVSNPGVENSARSALGVRRLRFVGAGGKVEFELLHLNPALAQPDFPLHIHESSYVALGRVQRRVFAHIPTRAPHKFLRHIMQSIFRLASRRTRLAGEDRC